MIQAKRQRKVLKKEEQGVSKGWIIQTRFRGKAVYRGERGIRRGPDIRAEVYKKR